ncbi:glutamate ABC transporter substrate-binding protein [Streptomyces antimycoticus]|uniref:glutamate ABC transporter substrate-binding protein n=1 Tax=Streptomyces antimycoticus TaxID=68175 RepID=UPI00367FDA6B
MDRHLSVVVAVAIPCTLLLAGCGGASEAARTGGNDSSWHDALIEKAPVADPSDIPRGTVLWDIHKKGTLVYGGSKTQPLFSQLNPTTNKLEGFDATLAQLLAKYLTGKPSVEQKIVTSETREALLGNGTIKAAIYTYSITPERDKKVDFAGPYFVSGQSIAVAKDTNDIHNLSDLAGRDVCVTKGGTAYLTMKAKVPSAKLVTLESSTECHQMLRQGRVDAEVQDQAIEYGQAAEGDVKVVGKALTYEPYGIGLPDNDPKAVKFVNAWLTQLIKSGAWQKLYDNTVGKAPGAKAEVPEPGKRVDPELHLG